MIERLASIFLRYSLVLTIGWIAAVKLIDYKVKAIEPLTSFSLLLSWACGIWTVRYFTMIMVRLSRRYLHATRPGCEMACRCRSIFRAAPVAS